MPDIGDFLVTQAFKKKQTNPGLCLGEIPAFKLAINSNAKTLKQVAQCLTRLWEKTDLAEIRDGALKIQKPDGTWVRVHADGGGHRGWLLPPKVEASVNAK